MVAEQFVDPTASPAFAEAAATELDEADPRPARKGRRAALIGGLIGALLVGAGGGYALTRGAPPPAASKPPLPSTATVTRTDLVNTQQEPGTLGYAGSYTVVGQAPPTSGTGQNSANPGVSGNGGTPGTGGPGGSNPTNTLTWLPPAGATVNEGQQLYGVDGHAVPLLYGSIPLYRTLNSGVSTGEDVRELNNDLRALGYRQAPDGNAFTSGTEQAVKDWQKALGVTQTGTVNPGDVVFEPGAVVVTAVSANLGASATGPLMTLSGTTKVITVNLPVTAETLATVGASVQVQLPNNATTSGHVTAIGTVAVNSGNNNGAGSGSGSGSGSGGGGGGSGATIPVTVSLDNPQAVGNLDGAPVTVNFTSAAHDNVLAVPVGALLALAEGGYAVNVLDADGRTHLVAVSLGMFAGGLVEVSGAGVHEGLKVEVAGTE
jgi:hypothetical protein